MDVDLDGMDVRRLAAVLRPRSGDGIVSGLLVIATATPPPRRVRSDAPTQRLPRSLGAPAAL